MRIYTPFLFLIILAGLSSCSQPKNLTYLGVQHFSIQNAGFKNSAVAADLQFYNPNEYALKLKHADVDVYINNSKLGRMILDTLYTIPRLDTFYIPVTLHVDMKNVLPNALQLLLNNKADIKLQGHVKAKRGFIYINIPVNYEGQQPLNLFN